MAIIKDNKDLDTTLMALTAFLLGIIVTVGLMVLHVMNPENSLLSPEICMALIQSPGLFASYALGKQKGQTEANGTGGQKQ